MTTAAENRLRAGEAASEARGANERFRDRRDAHRDSVFFALCECGRRGCRSGIELTVHEYDAIRRNADWQIVVAGHEYPSHRLVRATERYLLVTVEGAPAVANAVGARSFA